MADWTRVGQLPPCIGTAYHLRGYHGPIWHFGGRGHRNPTGTAVLGNVGIAMGEAIPTEFQCMS